MYPDPDHIYFPHCLEESYITQIEYGFDHHDVEIIDTAGQEEFMLYRDTSLAKGDGFLALFAVNSISSWYNIKQLRAKIVRENDDDEAVPMVVIANKNVSVNCCDYIIWILVAMERCLADVLGHCSAGCSSLLVVVNTLARSYPPHC